MITFGKKSNMIMKYDFQGVCSKKVQIDLRNAVGLYL